MSWILFAILGIFLLVYTVVFYLYLRNKGNEKSKLYYQQYKNSEKQKEIEKELIKLEHIELDLPKGVYLLPKGATDPSLSHFGEDH